MATVVVAPVQARADAPKGAAPRASAPGDPKLDNSFSPASVPVGRTSTLTFTVTVTVTGPSSNPGPGPANARRSWWFTDVLSPGLRLVRAAHARTNCAVHSLTADYGRNRIAVEGGALRPGQRSCEVVVGVTSDSPGTYRNSATNVTGIGGLALPGSADVTFSAASPERHVRGVPSGSSPR
ncbi:hypothetical protein AB0J52_05645 [Spirillospora sp. NPDC049652]